MRSYLWVGSCLLLASVAQSAPLTGTFVDLADGTYNDLSQIPYAVQAFKGLGMSTLVIAATALKPKAAGCATNSFEPSYLLALDGNPKGLACLPNSTDPVCAARWDGLFARVDAFLKAAKGNQMKVVVGLALSMGACKNFGGDQNDFPAQQNKFQTSYMNYLLTSKMEQRFGQSYHSTLIGYYIPDEVAAAHPAFQPFIATQVTAIRYASQRDIYNSPYLGKSCEFGYSPDLIGGWALSFLTNTGVNKLLYQDSVGAFMANMGGHPGEYTVEQYMTALVKWVGKDRIYADVELFNYGSPTSASLMRVNQQLWQSRMTGGRFAFIAQGQMYPKSVFNAHPGAPRLYNEYRAEFNGVGRRHGFSYRFIGNQPLGGHRDDGVKLHNTLVGGGRNPNDPQWVGLQGDAYLELDLGSARPIDFISIDLLSSRVYRIGYPSKADVVFSSDRVKWTSGPPLITEAIAQNTDGQYVLSNGVPFGKTARYVRLYFFSVAANPKTFLSEVTVTSAPRP